MRHKLYLDDYTQVGKNKITLPKALADYYGNTATAYVNGRQVESKGFKDIISIPLGYTKGLETLDYDWSTTFSLSAWIRLDENTNSSYYQFIFGSVDENSWDTGFVFEHVDTDESNLFRMYIQGLPRGSGVSLSKDEWNFITIQYNGNGTTTLYFNGSLEETISGTYVLNSTKKLWVGYAGVNSAVRSAEISCAEVLFLNSVLSESEIKSIMKKSVSGNETNLVAWYPLNGNADDFASSNNGTLYDTTWNTTIELRQLSLAFTTPTPTREIEIGRGNLELADVEPDTENRSVLSFNGSTTYCTLPFQVEDQSSYDIEMTIKATPPFGDGRGTLLNQRTGNTSSTYNLGIDLSDNDSDSVFDALMFALPAYNGGTTLM